MRELRARDDMRTVAIATPRGDLNHRLAVRSNAIAPDVAVAVYHGADADNPDAPGEKMCRNPEARRAAEVRRLDPTKLICPVCPMLSGCAYRAQAARRADIWLIPHNLIFVPKPRAIGDLAWLIVDENPVAAALIGAGDPNATGHRGPATTADDRHAAQGRQSQRRCSGHGTSARGTRATDRGAGGLAEHQAHASGADRGEIDRRYVRAGDTGLNTRRRSCRRPKAGCRSRIDWRNCAPRTRTPISVVASCCGAKQLALLRGKHETASRVEVTTLHEAEGMVRAVRLKGRRTIRSGWRVRTTIIDATLQPDLLRQIWRDVTVHDLGTLDAPHRHVVQVIDRAFSLAMLDADDPHIDEKERKRREANLRRLHVTLGRQVLGMCRPGTTDRVLVVAQKRIVAKLQALGALPGNIAWAHHGAVTGRDDWRDVRAVIVVGRSLPPPSAVEAQAEALTGAPIARLPRGAWYPLVDATRELADGTLVAAEAVRHPDPVAEAFRWRACEGELVQIIERARGVNRQSDAERVDVVVLTDVPLPMPVETMIGADDIAPRARTGCSSPAAWCCPTARTQRAPIRSSGAAGTRCASHAIASANATSGTGNPRLGSCGRATGAQ